MIRTVISRLPIGWTGRLALTRLFTQWRSLLVVIISAILGATIGANMPLYTTAIAQVGMIQALERAPREDAHFAARIGLKAPTPDEIDTDGTLAERVAAYDTFFQQTAVENLSATWADQIVAWAETSAMLPILEGEDAPVEGVRLNAAYYDAFADHVILIEGALPQGDPHPDVADVSAAIGSDAAFWLDLEVGDVITLDQAGWESSVPVRIQITGIVTAAAEEAAYWMPPSPLRVESSAQWEMEANVFVTKDALYRIATDFIPDTRTFFGWRVLFHHRALPVDRILSAADEAEAFDAALFDAAEAGYLPYYSGHTGLPALLRDYEQQISLLQAPFGLLLVQVGGLVLFFLVITAALVRRGERRELSMLRSRGSHDRQIWMLRGIEAFIICLIAAVVSPFLARQLLIWLMPLFTGLDEFPLALSASAFVYSAGASFIAFLALMLTLYPVFKTPLIQAGGAAARSGKQSWWQRYYLDVVLLVVGIAAAAQLWSTRSLLVRDQLGRLTYDPLLLLAPTLLFMALGSLMLRFFPGLTNLIAGALSKRRGIVGTLASWQVSREPVHYSRITLMLTLAIAIGWFATSFRATLSRSQFDQAAYRAGADARISERDVLLGQNRVRDPEFYAAAGPEILAASPVYREFTDLTSDVTDHALGHVLGVDAETFGDVIYWRDDLGDVQMPPPTGELPQVGRELPFMPAAITLWVRGETYTGFGSNRRIVPDQERVARRLEFFVKLQDADGRFIHVPFELVETEWVREGTDQPGKPRESGFQPTGWGRFRADFSGIAYDIQEPARLVSIYWRHNARARGDGIEYDIRIRLSELALEDAAGELTDLGWLTGGGWQLLYDSGAPIEDEKMETGIGRGSANAIGVGARVIQWDQEGTNSIMGLVLNYPLPGAPIPAVASRTLMEKNVFEVGAEWRLISLDRSRPTFRVVGVTDYYPTLYDGARAFLIADLESLLYALNRRPSAAVAPDEVWLDLAEGSALAEGAALREAFTPPERSHVVTRTVTLQDELGRLQSEPLSLGLTGLLFLAFGVALLLSVAGLISYSTLTAQSRQTEFSVLRALGLPAWRVVFMITLEQLFVIGVGTVLGAGLGFLLSDQVVPALAVGTRGEKIVPPFIVQVEAAALLQYAGILAAIFLLVMAALLILLRRLSVTRTLRLGEE